MNQLNETYKFIRLYGVIWDDVEWDSSTGSHRVMQIVFENVRYSVCMKNGNVYKIEV